MANQNITEFHNDKSVRMATNLQLKPGLKPRRVVLREVSGKFITHIECMHIAVRTEDRDGSTYDIISCTHESFDQGNYFDFEVNGVNKNDAFTMAMEDFESRAERL